jgi:two-component system, cell cycle response regulator
MVVSSSRGSQPSVVLVIDPDPARQRQMRDRLMALGYTARSVDDYDAALQLIANTPPDAVLLAGQAARGEGWNALQTQLNTWGIPLVDLGQRDDAQPVDGQQQAPPAFDDKALKLRVDAALQARTLQDALMTENARLSAERLHDPLTGLFNRRYIMIRVEEEVFRSSRRGHPLSCLLMDIDGFESINETWGHPIGDAVLREMAHLITRTMRGSDVSCRYRDDQFLVLLTDTDASGAQIAANRLRDAITGHNFFNPMAPEPIKLTASVGVAYWHPATKPDQAGTWEPQLLGLSERALKAAKQSGPNRLVILQAT